MKVSFVVSGHKCDEYIFRNIDSILDQDYKNYEIIVCLNGQWQTKDALITGLRDKYGYGDKFRISSLERAGLGYANNHGTSLATGDIVSCLSSDLYLMPGAVRTWIEAFQDHPECGFVYSGYKLVSKNPLDIYDSNPYDRYHLECENFVDGANPVKREHLAKWDEDLPSLIDWDYFLSVTDKDVKGFYIKEPLYYAELPKEGGLSDDSGRNWIRRRRDIQRKHNIPYREICIASVLDKEYALQLAKFANADFRIYPGHKPHEYRLIYAYGFPCDMNSIQISTGLFFQHYGHKIIQWVGPDIKTLIQLRWMDVDAFTERVLKRVEHHFCQEPIGQSILRKMGIDAEIIYPPLKIEYGEAKDSISVSDPELRSQLEKAMPDQKFVLNDTDCKISVHFEDRIDRTIMALAKGNHVISNYRYPGTYYIQGFSNIPELRKMIVHTIRSIQKIKPDLDQNTINEIRQKTSPKAFQNKLERIAEKKIQKYGKLEEVQANA